MTIMRVRLMVKGQILVVRGIVGRHYGNGGGACNADSGGSRNIYNRAGSEASKV